MNICVFGASITWGGGDNQKGGWADRLKVELMEKDHEVYNLGICGNTTDDLLKRFDIEAEARDPEIIIFGIGTNDSRYIKTKDNPQTSLAQFKNNIEELVQKAKELTNIIVIIGLTNVDESKTMPIPWRPDAYYSNENAEIYNNVLQEISKNNRMVFIDVFNLLDFSDFEDGLHPNSNGHKKMFDKIKEIVEQLIKEN